MVCCKGPAIFSGPFYARTINKIILKFKAPVSFRLINSEATIFAIAVYKLTANK